jgi:hypothetical protein
MLGLVDFILSSSYNYSVEDNDTTKQNRKLISMKADDIPVNLNNETLQYPPFHCFW